MKHYLKPLVSLSSIIFLTASLGIPGGMAQTPEEIITIKKLVDPAQVVPVAVSGFSGEVDKVVKFDLEVLGFEIVAPDKANYLVTGSNGGNVQGFLQDARTKQNHFGKAYAGGNLRQQAHAFADDIVQYLRGTKPIFQTGIAFKLDKGSVKEIAISDFDGHNAQQVTRDDTIAASPSWVPGQRVLVYNSYKDKFPAIFSHDLNNGVRRPVARYAGSNISPAAGRGGRVAMILSKGGSPNLYVSDLDGGNLRQLTKTREGESSPCWSPDGQQICFVSRRDGSRGLFVISAAGGEMRRIQTAGVGNATEPDWSPDGSTIVFTTQTGANSFDVCTVAATGGAVTNLVSGEDPSWAPNGRTVVFARRSGAGQKVLSLLDVPTKRVKDAARVSGSAAQPSWAR